MRAVLDVDQEGAIETGRRGELLLREPLRGAGVADPTAYQVASAQCSGRRLIGHPANVGTWLHDVCSHVPTLMCEMTLRLPPRGEP